MIRCWPTPSCSRRRQHPAGQNAPSIVWNGFRNSTRRQRRRPAYQSSGSTHWSGHHAGLMIFPVLAVCLGFLRSLPHHATLQSAAGSMAFMRTTTSAVHQPVVLGVRHTQQHNGNPIGSAKAVGALEYLTGELKENPRWSRGPTRSRYRMGLARNQLLAIVGYTPLRRHRSCEHALLALSLDLHTRTCRRRCRSLTAPLFITRTAADACRSSVDLPLCRSNLAPPGRRFNPSGRRPARVTRITLSPRHRRQWQSFLPAGSVLAARPRPAVTVVRNPRERSSIPRGFVVESSIGRATATPHRSARGEAVEPGSGCSCRWRSGGGQLPQASRLHISGHCAR